jgi:hypothetical protein
VLWYTGLLFGIVLFRGPICPSHFLFIFSLITQYFQRVGMTLVKET